MSFTTDSVHRGQRILFLVKEKLYTIKCMQEYNFYEQNFTFISNILNLTSLPFKSRAQGR